MVKKALIVNPFAGNSSVELKWPIIREVAQKYMGHFATYKTTAPGEAVRLTDLAVSEGATHLVCVGGDGTLNEVVNGIMGLEDSKRSNIVLGFIPDGTGCDFVKTLPVPVDIEKAVRLVASGDAKLIDIGCVRFKNENGIEQVRYFHNIASMGLGGEVDRRVNSASKRFGPFFSFIWATICAILVDGKKEINLQLDHHSGVVFNAWNIAVANGRYHGGGMLVAPDACLDDGLFDITVIGDLSVMEVFINLRMLYNGRIKEVSSVETFKAKELKAFSDQKVLLDIDGEQPGILPASFTVIPKALKMISAD